MLKLQEGKYYKRRDGVIVGPVAINSDSSDYPFRIYVNTYDINNLDYRTYSETGRYNINKSDYHLDLVEEFNLTQPKPFDPYAEVMPAWGMLTPDQQQMIKDNGPWQFFSDDGWEDWTNPAWAGSSTYRSKPKPEIKPLTTEEKLNAKLSKALEALRNAGITLKEIEGE
jgi:hypothetical protein